jgi:hypothetical protein
MQDLLLREDATGQSTTENDRNKERYVREERQATSAPVRLNKSIVTASARFVDAGITAGDATTKLTLPKPIGSGLTKSS